MTVLRAVALLLLLMAQPATARVISVAPSGFAVENVASIDAPPAKVFAALAEIGRWWSSSHSYSGNAANIRLKPHAGGRMCEAWDGNEIEHMRVVYVRPPNSLRLRGALGPLQGEGVDGALTYQIDADAAGSAKVVMNYVVGGYSRAAFAQLAPLVDQVLGEQLRRLERYVETGSAEGPRTR